MQCFEYYRFMKIIHLVPGSGGTFYCQNCLRDSALVREQRSMGHDAVLTPLYLPLLDDQHQDSGAPVFYGAISLYLRQQSAFLRKLPTALTRLADARPFLAMAARKAGSTRAAGLEAMTESMLLGDEGNQSAELQQLVTWLKSEGKPDVIHLSNALLLGLARRLRRELDVPIVCTLQDEDQWINPMPEHWSERIWTLMADRAGDVDAFVGVSHAYSARMIEEMNLNPDKVHVVWVGIDPTVYREAKPEVPVIGYLSRMCENLGLGELVDAFIELHGEPGLEQLRLHICGGHTGDDRKFLKQIKQKLKRKKLLSYTTFVDRLELSDRIDFLEGLSVLSVPIPNGEAFGAFQIEALAAAVPLVQPAVGAFPEIIEKTGGGIAYDPSQPKALVDALRSMLLDPKRARALGLAGRERVHEHFTMQRMASEIVEIYEAVTR